MQIRGVGCWHLVWWPYVSDVAEANTLLVGLEKIFSRMQSSLALSFPLQNALNITNHLRKASFRFHRPIKSTTFSYVALSGWCWYTITSKTMQMLSGAGVSDWKTCQRTGLWMVEVECQCASETIHPAHQWRHTEHIKANSCLPETYLITPTLGWFYEKKKKKLWRKLFDVHPAEAGDGDSNSPLFQLMGHRTHFLSVIYFSAGTV